MKIYTKTGDGGTTSLIGSRRVAKSHPRVEAYGSVDELSAHTAYLRDNIVSFGICGHSDDLAAILGHLMTVAAVFASDGSENLKMTSIGDDEIEFIESRIDGISEGLPEARAFTIPGGHPLVSLAHISRTVCRRAERCATRIGDPSAADLAAIRYLNRLSDYFYILGRKLASETGAGEQLWNPQK